MASRESRRCQLTARVSAGGEAVVADRDRRRYHEEAKTLLAQRPWTADHLDYAVRLHDLLEAPEDSPDPVARQLRARLARELDRYLTATDDPAYRVRRSFFSLPLLDTTDAFERRLFLLLYRGITNFLGYESGAQGQLNAAVEAYMELDRIVQSEGARASAILKDTYHSALLGLATACYTRYNDRRELLQAAPATEVEREIRADLDRAVAASERAADGSNPTTRASALAVLGSCYACRFEDDVDFNSPETINTAVDFLREALQLAEAVFRDSGRALAIEAPEPTSAPVLLTADEIAAVQACHSAEFRVIWLPGAEATRPQLRRALSQFEVLHFAGHAHADPDPLAGGLLLAPDECLTIRELLASGIGAARFAVLLACDTARDEDLMSDEMVSFPTALMQCGFGGVIGSLWAASDRPTTMLMKAFYREWRDNATSPRQALRAAQQ